MIVKYYPVSQGFREMVSSIEKEVPFSVKIEENVNDKINFLFSSLDFEKDEAPHHLLDACACLFLGVQSSMNGWTLARFHYSLKVAWNAWLISSYPHPLFIKATFSLTKNGHYHLIAVELATHKK